MPLRLGFSVTLVCLALAQVGCQTTWRDPRPAGGAANWADHLHPAAAADRHYRQTLAAWCELERLEPGTAAHRLACQCYHAHLQRLLATAREGCRFVPGQGLLVGTEGRTQLVPLVCRGPVWQPSDVQRIWPVGDYHTAALSRRHAWCGWGVPVVVERSHPTGGYAEEEFLPPGMMFSATAVLRSCDEGVVLELFDPLRMPPEALSPAGPMAGDLSAPFALREARAPQLASGWLPFLGADLPEREGLFLTEPYQPGKIPVVLVHGLLSSPMSWVDMANDLRAAPGFTDRFQLWGFRYDTGKPFLEAAARLRRDLYRVVPTVDPQGCDPALQNMVLVGHSMGGLVCQLQVVASEDRLWNAAANRPVEALHASEATQAELRELFFFDPQPHVGRLILLATPHCGSSWARRPIGRLGSLLARPDARQKARHQQLRRDNPGVFAPELVAGIPTSIDMLDPQNAFLQVIGGLPICPRVATHTIFGYGRSGIGQGPGDGVVSIASATAATADSQLGVEASHTMVHRQRESVDEVLRILERHWAETTGQWSAVDPRSPTRSPFGR